LDEKALGSGGKSEDQPSIGKMPDALDVRVVLAIRILFLMSYTDSALIMRIRVLLYKFPGGGLS
jgi:hypothetical protein